MEHHFKTGTWQGQAVQCGVVYQLYPNHVPRPLQRLRLFHIEEPESHIHHRQDTHWRAWQWWHLIPYTSDHKVVSLSHSLQSQPHPTFYSQVRLILYSCVFHRITFLSLSFIIACESHGKHFVKASFFVCQSLIIMPFQVIVKWFTSYHKFPSARVYHSVPLHRSLNKDRQKYAKYRIDIQRPSAGRRPASGWGDGHESLADQAAGR